MADPRGQRPLRRPLDPELAAMQVLVPDLDIADFRRARTIERAHTEEMRRQWPRGDVQVSDLKCPRDDGSTLLLRLYRPSAFVRHQLPVLLFIHGGSFVTGGLHTEDSRCESYATGAGCAVVAVDYRLAPEHPFPAALDDCQLALDWIVVNCSDFGLDPTRIGVGGLSAGGALAAGTALRARDSAGPALALQLLLFPVLDARADTPSSLMFTDTPVLTSAMVQTMWRLYLGPDWVTGCEQPPKYASPAQAEDLRQLPATYLCAAEFDPLRDEALSYARRLIDQEVPVDLRYYARAFHAFDSFLATRMAGAAMRDQQDALRAAFR